VDNLPRLNDAKKLQQILEDTKESVRGCWVPAGVLPSLQFETLLVAACTKHGHTIHAAVFKGNVKTRPKTLGLGLAVALACNLGFESWSTSRYGQRAQEIYGNGEEFMQLVKFTANQAKDDTDQGAAGSTAVMGPSAGRRLVRGRGGDVKARRL